MQLAMFCNSPVIQAEIRTGPTDGCKAPRLLQIYKHLNWAGLSVYTASGGTVLLPEMNYKNAVITVEGGGGGDKKNSII